MSAPASQGWSIRPYHPSDAPGCHRVFFNAVRIGAACHYDEAQRAAWAPFHTMPDTWPDKLGNHISYVAQDTDIIGFMTLGHDGHLDLAYVAPGHMGRGVGAALYRALLADKQAPPGPLTTEASHLARPFFLALGWQLVAEQQIDRRGVRLTNFRMRLTR